MVLACKIDFERFYKKNHAVLQWMSGRCYTQRGSGIKDKLGKSAYSKHEHCKCKFEVHGWGHRISSFYGYKTLGRCATNFRKAPFPPRDISSLLTFPFQLRLWAISWMQRRFLWKTGHGNASERGSYRRIGAEVGIRWTRLGQIGRDSKVW